jgi:hypothetical protein
MHTGFYATYPGTHRMNHEGILARTLVTVIGGFIASVAYAFKFVVPVFAGVTPQDVNAWVGAIGAVVGLVAMAAMTWANTRSARMMREAMTANEIAIANAETQRKIAEIAAGKAAEKVASQVAPLTVQAAQNDVRITKLENRMSDDEMPAYRGPK